MFLDCTQIFHTKMAPLFLRRDWITERKSIFQLIYPVILLKNNILEFSKTAKTVFKQKRGMAIRTKFAPPFSIQFMAELKEAILRKAEVNLIYGGGILKIYFFLWEHGEEKTKVIH